MSLDGAPSQKIEDQADKPEALRKTYLDLVKNSKLNAAEKEACNKWLNEEQESHEPAKLKERISFLPRAEESSQKLVSQYEKKIEDAVKKELFSTDTSKKTAYVDWFKKLSFADKMKHLEKSDLDKPERKAVLEAFKKLPAAVRDEHRDEFFKGGLEERQKLVAEAAEKHETLKAAFLKLPKEVQEQNKTKFKESKLADREKLLRKLGVENASNLNKKGGVQEDVENKRLGGDFDAKMARMVRDNLFSPLSVPKYQQWFAGLTLDAKKQALQKSDLDNPKRVQVRDQFLALPQEVSKMHDLKFRNADLEKRTEILASAKLEKPTQVDAKKQSWFKGFLKRVLSSSSREGVSNKMESFSIASEVAERRRRFRISQSTSGEKRDETAAKEGLGETLQQSRRVETAAKSEQMYDKDGKLRLKLDVLETKQEDRHQLRLALKPDVQKQDAMLAGNISLQTKTGDRVTDEREYQQGELKRELAEVEAALTPIIGEAANTDGVSLTQQQIQQLLEKEDWRAHAKENIQRAV
ncbi:MAG: hypothetical protein AAB606_03175 [Patescibacteria group bacterium]